MSLRLARGLLCFWAGDDFGRRIHAVLATCLFSGHNSGTDTLRSCQGHVTNFRGVCCNAVQRYGTTVNLEGFADRIYRRKR